MIHHFQRNCLRNKNDTIINFFDRTKSVKNKFWIRNCLLSWDYVTSSEPSSRLQYCFWVQRCNLHWETSMVLADFNLFYSLLFLCRKSNHSQVKLKLSIVAGPPKFGILPDYVKKCYRKSNEIFENFYLLFDQIFDVFKTNYVEEWKSANRKTNYLILKFGNCLFSFLISNIYDV